MGFFSKKYKLPDNVTSGIKDVHANVVGLAPDSVQPALNSNVGWFIVGGAVTLTSYFVIRRIIKFFL
ncbi:MAG: hypothetical protein Harvfovirus48_10 [Harvfovirus sp.]|uniref:Uncharacterized protein n=1 Tax=Harvfovirus sp. TaxID=2487768 RepID=A0A3G5A352_9VIRU|nr:MAG: hypothetical protein Harvfovirus48_10 [Harvfovirus sp.]